MGMYRMVVVEDSRESLQNALKEVIWAFQNGYGIGLDLSKIDSGIRREQIRKSFEINIRG